TSQLLQSIFIQPACLLVDHINRASQDMAPESPKGVPMVWQSSFQTVSDTFDANRYLLQEREHQLHELKSTQLQLVQSEKMSALGNLVAGVAHEINNPLGFVKGNLQELGLNISDVFEHLEFYQNQEPQEAIADHAEDIDLDYLLEDIPKMLASMETGCDRIKNISTSLRTFSRADQSTKAAFDIHEGLDSTILILKHRLKANEHRPAIQVDKHYGDVPPVGCFPGQLNQVFMNILANAIDVFDEMAQHSTFSELEQSPQMISVKTSISKDAQLVDIRIRDNGKGMTDEVMAKVFDHLFTTKAVGKGTGLGLAIAHQIVVETHGGSLDVNSKVGQGTEFRIALPLSVIV
ncbi:MAG: HAMP domain-containing histidine kinase, partial [Symploca sp. SIO2B6]|nr:HAMP domain-containing histidine kinase [Symploca sp. SIO2B6]